jgi:hypothetical protein
MQNQKKDYLAELGDLCQEFNKMKLLLVHLSKDSQKQLVTSTFKRLRIRLISNGRVTTV